MELKRLPRWPLWIPRWCAPSLPCTGAFTRCGFRCEAAPEQLPAGPHASLRGQKAPDTTSFLVAQYPVDLCSLDVPASSKLEFLPNSIILPIVISISCHQQLRIINSKQSSSLKAQTSSIGPAASVQTTRSPSIKSTPFPLVGARSFPSRLSAATPQNVSNLPSVPLLAQQVLIYLKVVILTCVCSLSSNSGPEI